MCEPRHYSEVANLDDKITYKTLSRSEALPTPVIASPEGTRRSIVDDSAYRMDCFAPLAMTALISLVAYLPDF